MEQMMKNRVLDLLPFLLIGDLILPFLLATTYPGYNHLTQVMSVLGNSKHHCTFSIIFG